MSNNEYINCPLCDSENHNLWARENGYNCVKCLQCGLLFVNPRPSDTYVNDAIRLGGHTLEDGTHLNTKTRWDESKTKNFESVIKLLFPDLLKHSPVSWLDVGAGYGEFIQVLMNILPLNSKIEGLEPMLHKVQIAQKIGLPVKHGYLHDINEKVNVVSIIDVFSHLPDFHQFLSEVKKILLPQGNLLLKTGNAADVGERKNFPGPLNFPDHLVFGGEAQISQFLEMAGFEVIDIKAERIDGIVYTIKNLIKKLIGQPVHVSFPFTSPTRTLWIRARLR